MKKPYSVGYIRDGWPKEVIVKRFKNQDKAAAFLSHLEKHHGDDEVAEGAYSLMGPAEDY